MAQQPIPSIENHFIEGLKTEFTGLNFPENAATDTQNCVYTLIGDVLRREGINYEVNFVTNVINRSNSAVSSYKWKNVGGDGLTEIVVLQVGGALYFFKSTAATIVAPLSTTLLASTIVLQAVGSTQSNVIPIDGTVECQFSDGNGFLFVYHPSMDPIFCTYNSTNSTVTSKPVVIKIRDFAGIPESGVPDNFRPSTLTVEHNYNLQNQGWTSGAPWSGVDSTTGSHGWPPQGSTGIVLNINSQTNTTSIVNGSIIQCSGTGVWDNGINFFPQSFQLQVTSYVTPFTTVTGNIISTNYPGGSGIGVVNQTYNMQLVNLGFIQTWLSAIGNYPSNSDVWWLYKNTSLAFSPGTQISNVQQSFGAAPKGYYILNAFTQQRTAVSGVQSLTDITTSVRPSTGTWFQGRVWFTGVNASQQATGDEPYYTWTENIYFSQTAVTSDQFSKCYQINDPTSQILFDILPTDGGVITIQGSGTIYKLFPLENGLLVFAANGIWFITGSQGIGFAANDYTIRKIANIQSISSTSFVNVNGYPMFWNEEGIYYVTPSQQGTGLGQNAMSFQVNNLCLGTILTFYGNIPKQSKKFVRGDYNSIDYIVQWCYRSTNESTVTDRYQFDSILNFNLVNKAFYPYTLPTVPLTNNNTPWIHDIKFIQNPGGTGAPGPTFKYITSAQRTGIYNFTFSEENDLGFIDWRSEDNLGVNFISYFITGYKLTGQAVRKQQIPYVYFFSRNPSGVSYLVQSIWDYAISGNSGKFSQLQRVNHFINNFAMMYKKVRLRGRGLAVQIKVTSVQGQPFDLMGWSVWNELNTGI